MLNDARLTWNRTDDVENMGKVFVPPKLILAAEIVPTSPPVTLMVPVTLIQPLMSRGALLLNLDANDSRDSWNPLG